MLDVDGNVLRAGRLADVDEAELHDAAAALQRARILAHDEPLRYVHPILRAAVYGDLTSAEREGLHRRAADLLEEAGQADRAAAHLLLTQPAGDPEVVARLRAAAARAMRQGAADSAAQLLERALAEPARDGRFELLVELALAQTMVGIPTDAALREAQELATEPIQRLVVAWSAGLDLAQRQRVADAVAALDAGLDAATAVGRPAVLQTEAFRGFFATGLVAQQRAAQERLERVAATCTGSTLEERHVLAAVAHARCLDFKGTAAEVVSLVDRACGEDGFTRDGLNSWSPFHVVAALGFAGEVPRSGAHTARLLEAYRQTAHQVAVTNFINWQAYLAYFSGDLEEAESRLLESLSMVGHERLRMARPWRVRLLAEVRLLRGDLDGADRALSDGGYAAGFPDELVYTALTVIRARSLLRSAQGRHDEAVADVEQMYEVTRPTLCPTLVDQAPQVLWAAGRGAEAEAAGRELVAVARTWGSPVYLGITLRTLGGVVGGDEALPLLSEAIDCLDGRYAKLELARALIDYGAALRRRKERQASREPLSRGRELALRCGAVPLADRAEEELAATGARARSIILTGVESLTASERRVAQMAADGLTNPEIAQALYVSRKTVETHLRHVFQKLDVESRRQLPALLTASA